MIPAPLTPQSYTLHSVGRALASGLCALAVACGESFIANDASDAGAPTTNAAPTPVAKTCRVPAGAATLVMQEATPASGPALSNEFVYWATGEATPPSTLRYLRASLVTGVREEFRGAGILSELQAGASSVVYRTAATGDLELFTERSQAASTLLRGVEYLSHGVDDENVYLALGGTTASFFRVHSLASGAQVGGVMVAPVRYSSMISGGSGHVFFVTPTHLHGMSMATPDAWWSVSLGAVSAEPPAVWPAFAADGFAVVTRADVLVTVSLSSDERHDLPASAVGNGTFSGRAVMVGSRVYALLHRPDDTRVLVSFERDGMRIVEEAQGANEVTTDGAHVAWTTSDGGVFIKCAL